MMINVRDAHQLHQPNIGIKLLVVLVISAFDNQFLFVNTPASWLDMWIKWKKISVRILNLETFCLLQAGDSCGDSIKGKTACTKFTRISTNGIHSIVLCEPITGRTHQV